MIRRRHLTGINGIIWVNGPGDQVYCFVEGLEDYTGMIIRSG